MYHYTDEVWNILWLQNLHNYSLASSACDVTFTVQCLIIKKINPWNFSATISMVSE